ncbi:Fur family transcriptional regulator [Leeuwenhoekiella aestuarii]|uniref:Fur family ferric uptake transcriptional regulator n=1 Tax=Leeuwenhoekiella aestuarii TaxID=2249426 RepID=A0A4Q0NRJ3_9FLAO|nr:transcriptional repressor [Leeuwenhoekiella aestuarii]RXG13240.1 Fur family ferric uptake transcriptional regulator [Leeuwenhoekiella aestuarii]
MRNTVARDAILEIINTTDEALSQSDVQAKLPEGLCNRVTIYRVLDRLVDEHLAHKITNIDGVIKYANCQSCTTKHKHNHLHFNCERCNTVTCIEAVEPSFKLPANYEVKNVNFLVSGICPDCKEN